MRDFLQILLVGINDGAAYAMLGLGLVVIYRSSGVLNFAQGEQAMVSTFMVSTAWLSGAPLWVAIFIGMIGGFLTGVLLYQLFIRSASGPNKSPLTAVIVTIGLFLALNGLAQVIWGTLDRKWARPFGNSEIIVGGLAISWQKIGTVVMLGVVAFAFYLLFQRTRLGLAMRTVASNPESAALVGMPVSRLLMLGWGMASTIGTLAGITMATNLGLNTNLMQMTLIFAFAAITLGGFDSFVGAVVGGIIIGVMSSTVPRYVGVFEKMPLAPAFIVIIFVLLVRPQGLFGKKGVSRV